MSRATVAGPGSPSTQSPLRSSGVAAGGAVGAAALVLLGAAPAGAHTGLPAHGLFDGAAHPILGLDHLLAMVAVGVLAAFSARRLTAWMTPTAFVVGMIAGGALGLNAVTPPPVEVAIAASVVFLGGAVTFAVRPDNAPTASDLSPSAVLIPLAAGSFGLLHGVAHGAELPDAAAPFPYFAGFVVVTATLHVVGAGVGLALRRAPRVQTIAGTAMTVVGAGMMFTA